MFNTPIVDVALGLVLVYLIYSLLATSIKEAIATLFAMRSRMLKKGINSMLSQGKTENRWKNLIKGAGSYLHELVYVLTGWRRKVADSLSSRFYHHPLISSYGSNRMFPNPAYIPTANFSLVLVALLKKEFETNAMNIAQQKNTSDQTTSITDLHKSLLALDDLQKIQALLDYYEAFHAKGGMPHGGVIDKDTLQILQLHIYRVAQAR